MQSQMPATIALLNGLHSAHDNAFPVGTHLPSRRDTAEDGSSEAGGVGRESNHYKAALVRTVVGGWLASLEGEEGKNGSHVGESGTNLASLMEAMRGPLQYCTSHPNALLFVSSSEGAPIQIGGDEVMATTSAVTMEGGSPAGEDVDLATYLFPRMLRAAASLDAALLTVERPGENDQSEPAKLYHSRENARNRLEEFLIAIIQLLSQNAVGAEWTNYEGPVQGGVGKARAIVNDLIEMLTSLGSASPTYPRRFYFSSNSPTVAAGDPFKNRPSIPIQSHLHYRALLLTTLRILLGVTSNSLIFSESIPSIVEILTSTWPSSPKGKEKATGTRSNILAATIDLVAVLLQGSLKLSPLIVEKLAIRACETFQERLFAEDEGEPIDRPLSVIFCQIKCSLEREDVSHNGLRQLLAEMMVDSGEGLVRCFIKSNSIELRTVCLFLFASPAAPPPSSQPDRQNESTVSTFIDLLSSAPLTDLSKFVAPLKLLPFRLPPHFQPLAQPVDTAWIRVKTCLEVLFPVAARVGKRPRDESGDALEGENAIGNESGRRKKGIWREAVGKILREGLHEQGLNWETEGLETFIARMSRSIPTQTTQQGRDILQTIGLVGCTRDGTLATQSIVLEGKSLSQALCSICDEGEVSSSSSTTTGRIFTRTPLDGMRSIATHILASQDDLQLKYAYLRCWTRLLRHSRTEFAAIPFGSDEAMDQIFATMASPVRGLRLSAGTLLVTIIQAHRDHDASTAFVKPLFDRMDGIPDSNPAIMETTLRTISKIALCGPSHGWLECQAVTRLISRFGNRNFFLKRLARTELDEVAATRRIKAFALVQPHFEMIGPILVNSMSASPATLTAVCDFLQLDSKTVLHLTREYTLPKLVLEDRIDIIRQISDASGLETPNLLAEVSAASAILSFLFTQPAEPATEKGLTVFMREIGKAKTTNPVTLEMILGSTKIPLAFRLAYQLGDEDADVRLRAERAFKSIERRLSPGVKKIDLGAVLKSSIVGILSQMNRGLNESMAHRPLRYKQQIIRSLEIVTGKVGPAIAGFSPQIMATLQGALEVPGLREVALSAYHVFINALKFNEVGPYIGTTSATFVRLWNEFTAREKELATKTLDYIIVHRSEGLVNFMRDVADLSGIPELSKSNAKLRLIRKNWTFTERSNHLLIRIRSENNVVALQALKELKELMLSARTELQAYSAGDSFDSSVGKLIQVVLAAAAKDGVDNEKLRNMACECIGVLGALDPDRFDMPAADSPTIVLRDFDDNSESTAFALRLVQDLLIGVYRSTNDTKHQELVAFAIQELLTFCGFTADLVQSDKSVPVSDARTKWINLPKIVLETCGPLLGSSFKVTVARPPPTPIYPIYAYTSSYRDWVGTWTSDLISCLRGKDREKGGMDVERIFTPFLPVVRSGDITVARHLLPHLVLHTVISGSDEDRANVKNEMERVLVDQVDPKHQVSENGRLLSAQTVFDLMDHLSLWITKSRQEYQTKRAALRKTKGQRMPAHSDLSETLLQVEGVLSDIPQDLVAKAALTCKAFARSLLNFENRIVAQRSHQGDGQLQEYYERLHECYASLDEPDGMEGISTKIVSPTVWHQIREHESTGRWTSAQSCWEVKLQEMPEDPACHIGLLRCLRNLGHYDSMRTHIVGLLHSGHNHSDWDRILAPFNIEASLIVSDWDAVEEGLRIPNLEGPEAAFGRVITAMRQGEKDQLAKAFYDAREQLGSPIVASGKGSYRQVYDSIVNLHILHELEAVRNLTGQRSSATSSMMSKTLLARLESTSPTFKAREPILNMQRTILSLDNSSASRAEIGQLWLETSKIARKAGHSQTAYSAILQANNFDTPFVFLQRAKLLKVEDQSYKAIQDINNALHSLIPAGFGLHPTETSTLTVHGRPTMLAKASLRRARWMHEAGRLDQNGIIEKYQEANRLAPDWESPCYYLGHYWDQLSRNLEYKKDGKSTKESKTRMEEALGFQQQTCRLYSQALTFGTKYIYQALPRMLTIWLELAEQPDLMKVLKAKKKNLTFSLDGYDHAVFTTFTAINKLMDRNVKKLPSYQWLTVLPQLVSRISHANDSLYEVLERMLLRVIASYPHQGFWAMASGAKSTTSRRSRRCTKVFAKAKDVYAKGVGLPININSLLTEGMKLVESLLDLCNFVVNKETTLSLHRQFPNLYRLAPTILIIPLQNALNVSLPTDASHIADHKPFPDGLVVFQNFLDEVDIMSSLQKPRKITVFGSDGKSYAFLCKPKDDLRKDARLMEFNSMIIKLLKKDSESRKRGLCIRTYAVVPLNEECGLIEWVPNVVVLRTILNKSYGARGIVPWTPELKGIFDTIRDVTERTAEIFETQVLAKFPPVFHEWFLETFPEPSAWLRARLAYSRTAAVMSMVGFVLGLGDRHCENILLEGTTGDTVHVDFNCLFDKARTFDVPERVPFRLTHNIIDGMGVTGVEGVFRRSSEITLRILRDNKESLLSVLETFVHDPLVEWNTRRRGKAPLDPEEQARSISIEARRNLDPISLKLRGLQVTSNPNSISEKEASVGEQVERLIREARDSKNLGSTYCGWTAWF